MYKNSCSYAAFTAFLGLCVVNVVQIQASVFIGEPCNDNSTCQLVNLPSFCNEGHCECIPGYVPNIHKTRCLQLNVMIGLQCEENLQCVDFELRRSLCLPGSQMCVCVSGYVPRGNRSNCLPVINTLGSLGEECQDNSQCQAGKPGGLSICSTSTTDQVRRCRCSGSATDAPFPNNNYCYMKGSSSTYCKVDAQCNESGGICVEGRCRSLNP